MKLLHQSGSITRNGEEIKFRRGEDYCPVCASQLGGDVIFQFEEYSIVKCSVCNTMHLKPMPDDESLYLIYNTNYYKDVNEEHGYKDYRNDSERVKQTYLKRLTFIKSKLPKSGLTAGVLEIGCALGYGLQVARQLFDVEISGADLSLEAVDTCIKAGFKAKQCLGDGTFSLDDENKYGLIYAFDVIEHLKNTQHFVEWAESILSDNGILALTTPNMNNIFNKVLGKRSPTIKIPQHIIYFTTSTLKYALRERFDLIATKLDYQYVSMRALFIRIRHILGLTYKSLDSIPEINIAVPNGMNIYIFCKKNREPF